MKLKINLFILIGIVLLFTGASCDQTIDGGVYKSVDQGENWEQKVFVSQQKRKVTTIGEYTIFDLEFDPFEREVIFAGTKGHGVVVTPNGGEKWFQTGQNTGNVYSIDIDPIDNNIIYAAMDSYILKSEDRGDNWEIVHTDTKKNLFTRVIIDSYDPSKIYASNMSGIVYKSQDQGINWDIKLQLEDGIKDLFMRKKDTRILYALAENGKVYKTSNGAELEQTLVVENEDNKKNENEENTVNDAWQDIYSKENKELWPNTKSIKNFYISPAEPDAMYIMTKHGLMKSYDEGFTWIEVKTLLAVDDSDNEKIVNFMVDPLEPKTIYFTFKATDKIHKSTDGGERWKVIEDFPSTKQIKTMEIHPEDPSIIYIGMEIPEEQNGFLKVK